jgi:hypothetical protein
LEGDHPRTYAKNSSLLLECPNVISYNLSVEKSQADYSIVPEILEHYEKSYNKSGRRTAIRRGMAQPLTKLMITAVIQNDSSYILVIFPDPDSSI